METIKVVARPALDVPPEGLIVFRPGEQNGKQPFVAFHADGRMEFYSTERIAREALGSYERAVASK